MPAGSKIEVVGNRTWGELGNILAAHNLGRLLERELDCCVEVSEAEKLFPRFGQIGRNMGELSQGSKSALERNERYLDLMKTLEETFPPEFDEEQTSLGALEAEVQAVGYHFAATKPDVVIGTKGVTSRVCRAGIRRARLNIPVLNFVTNQGLLSLPIHRSRHLLMNFVQFPEARDLLVHTHGFATDRVTAIGPLVAVQTALPRWLHGQTDFLVRLMTSSGRLLAKDKPAMLICCTRWADDYLRILEFVAASGVHIDLIFIAPENASVVETALKIRAKSGQPHWKILGRISQKEYLGCIASLMRSRAPLVIAKTGPNIVLEALYFGVPVLTLDSGLPMENWIVEFVNRNGLGWASAKVDQLLPNLDRLIRHPDEVAARCDSIRAYSRRTFDTTKTARLLGSAIETAISNHGC